MSKKITKKQEEKTRTINVYIDAVFTGLTWEKSLEELQVVFKDHLEGMGIAGGLKYDVSVVVEESPHHLK